jgi:hypothetical protein
VHQRASAEVADDETDVVADDGGDHRHDDHDGDVHVTRTGEDGRRDQVGLPGQRDAEVFQQHKSADREVAVMLHDGLQMPEHARQLGPGHAALPASRCLQPIHGSIKRLEPPPIR